MSDASLTVRSARAWVWAQRISEKRKKLLLLALLEFTEDPTQDFTLSPDDVRHLAWMIDVSSNTVPYLLREGFGVTNTVECSDLDNGRLRVRLHVRGGEKTIPHPEYVPHIKDAPGFVYLIRGGDFYKIGRCKDVSARARAIQTGCPYKVEVVASREVPDAATYEAHLHETYKDMRTSGEWFGLDYPQVEALKKALSRI